MSSVCKKIEEGGPVRKLHMNDNISSNLAQFPQELLTLVAQNLGKQDLKRARLTSKHLCASATPLLFKDWTIFPHQRSFDTLRQIYSVSRVAQSITSLTYDARFAHTTDCLLTVLGKALQDRAYSRDEHKRIIEPARSLDLGSFTNESKADDAVLTALLIQAFSKLPNVKYLVILASSQRPHDEDEVPAFYNKLWTEAASRLGETGLGDAWPPEIMSPHTPCEISVLTAACALETSLSSLELNGIGWSKIFHGSPMYKSPHLYLPTFSGLKHLRLRSKGDRRMDKFIVDLQLMLRLAAGLEELVLRLAYEGTLINVQDIMGILEGHGQYSIFQTRGLQVSARLTWSPKLQQLDLGGIECSLPEMKSVLEHCSSSLKVLKLRNIILVPNADDRPACLVELFKYIQQTLKLDSFKADGYFTNGGMQNWQIRPTYHDSGWIPRVVRPSGQGLCDRLEAFVQKGGSCSLDFVAIPEGHFDLGRRQRHDHAPRTFRRADFLGDSTLEMYYPESAFLEEESSDEDYPGLRPETRHLVYSDDSEDTEHHSGTDR